MPPSLTLLLQFEDHLLGFLLLGAVSALDLLDLAVLSVQDLQTDGDILVHFKHVLQIIGLLEMIPKTFRLSVLIIIF